MYVESVSQVRLSIIGIALLAAGCAQPGVSLESVEQLYAFEALIVDLLEDEPQEEILSSYLRARRLQIRLERQSGAAMRLIVRPDTALAWFESSTVRSAYFRSTEDGSSWCALVATGEIACEPSANLALWLTVGNATGREQAVTLWCRERGEGDLIEQEWKAAGPVIIATDHRRSFAGMLPGKVGDSLEDIRCVLELEAVPGTDDSSALGFMLDANTLFWLGSTIAQCVVALLAFAAVLVVWRLDALTRGNQGDIDELYKKARELLYSKLADDPLPPDLPGNSRHQLCEAGSYNVYRVLDADDVKILPAFDVTRQTHQAWASHSNWQATLDLALEILQRRRTLAPRLSQGMGAINTLQHAADRVEPTVDLITLLRTGLRRITTSGFVALATSLLTVALARTMQVYGALQALLVPVLVITTTVALVAGIRIGWAIFEQPDAWKSE